MALSVQDPQTQLNVNSTLKKLWRRVETMRRTNSLAAARYRSRHFWLWLMPISLSAFLAALLSLVTGVGAPGPVRLGLSLATGFFAAGAYFLNFLQSRLGRSGRATVHRSAEVEPSQVTCRLETLGKYGGLGLTTGSHSTKSRANAIRDLYRIDVYLQAMLRVTPDIPACIDGLYSLLADRRRVRSS